MQSVHTMRPTATDGVTWSACLSVGHIREPCKMAETIEMQFGWMTRVGQRNNLLDGARSPTGRDNLGVVWPNK